MRYNAIAESWEMQPASIERTANRLCYAMARLRKLHNHPLEAYENSIQLEEIDFIMIEIVEAGMLIGVAFGVKDSAQHNEIDLTKFR